MNARGFGDPLDRRKPEPSITDSLPEMGSLCSAVNDFRSGELMASALIAPIDAEAMTSDLGDAGEMVGGSANPVLLAVAVVAETSNTLDASKSRMLYAIAAQAWDVDMLAELSVTEVSGVDVWTL